MARDMQSGFRASGADNKARRNAVKAAVKAADDGGKTKKLNPKKLTAALAGRVKKVAPDRIVPNGYNYNKVSSFMMDKLRDNIQTFGFTQPIVVRSGNEKGTFSHGNYVVIDGEHRLKLAKELKLPEVRVIDMGNVSDVIARTLTINLNEIGGRPDQDQLSALVSEISKMDSSLVETLPFDDEEIEAMTSLGEEDFSKLDEFAASAAETDNFTEEEEADEDIISYLGLEDVSAPKAARFLLRAQALAAKIKHKDGPGHLLNKIFSIAEEKHGIKLKADDDAT